MFNKIFDDFIFNAFGNHILWKNYDICFFSNTAFEHIKRDGSIYFIIFFNVINCEETTFKFYELGHLVSREWGDSDF